MFEFIKKLFAPDQPEKACCGHCHSHAKTGKHETKFPGVVVAEIKSIEKHPNADKLRLTKVDIAAGELLDIVCGAPNIEVGQKVPCATVGTVLPQGMEIKEANIRGEKSFGMLCAADELGLGEDHNGILILPATAIIGDNIDQYLK